MPAADVAVVTARTIACAITSAASAPIVAASASPIQRPVASEKIVSPSAGVWMGVMARAYPESAICATRLASAFVSLALVATTPMVVFPPAIGVVATNARLTKADEIGRAHV